MSSRFIVTLSLLVIVPFHGSLYAQKPEDHRSEKLQKPPWQWTLEERITDRLDQELIEARNRVYEVDHAKALAAVGKTTNEDTGLGGEGFVYRIDGKRNPELFLPHELFQALLSGLVPDEELRSKQRSLISNDIREWGYDEEAFWNTLASVSGEFLVIRYDGGRSGENDALCSARYEALLAARELLGGEDFDRFLFSVVAPHLQGSEATTSRAAATDRLKAEAEGCR